MVNVMILDAKVPFNLAGEALLTTYHVHNIITFRKIYVSPYKLWKGRKPNLYNVRDGIVCPITMLLS